MKASEVPNDTHFTGSWKIGSQFYTGQFYKDSNGVITSDTPCSGVTNLPSFRAEVNK